MDIKELLKKAFEAGNDSSVYPDDDDRELDIKFNSFIDENVIPAFCFTAGELRDFIDLCNSKIEENGSNRDS